MTTILEKALVKAREKLLSGLMSEAQVGNTWLERANVAYQEW